MSDYDTSSVYKDDSAAKAAKAAKNAAAQVTISSYLNKGVNQAQWDANERADTLAAGGADIIAIQRTEKIISDAKNNPANAIQSRKDAVLGGFTSQEAIDELESAEARAKAGGSTGIAQETKVSTLPPTFKKDTSIIKDLIGLPPLYYNATDSQLNTLLETLTFNTMPVVALYPAYPAFGAPDQQKLGLQLYHLDYVKGLEKYNKIVKSVTSKSQLTLNGNCLYVAFLNDTSISEAFSVDFGESKFEEIGNMGSATLAELRYLTGGSDASNAIGLTGDAMKKGFFGNMAGSLLKGVAGATGIMESLMSGIGASGLTKIFSGSKIDFPMIWKGVNYGPSYSFTIRLYNPISNNEKEYEDNIIKPLVRLLAFVMPIADSESTFTFPILCGAVCPGLFKVNAGFISSIDVIKGGESNDISYSQRPGSIDIKITIQDLYNTMVVDGMGGDEKGSEYYKFKDTQRPLFSNYIDNLRQKVAVKNLTYDKVKGYLNNQTVKTITPPSKSMASSRNTDPNKPSSRVSSCDTGKKDEIEAQSNSWVVSSQDFSNDLDYTNDQLNKTCSGYGTKDPFTGDYTYPGIDNAEAKSVKVQSEIEKQIEYTQKLNADVVALNDKITAENIKMIQLNNQSNMMGDIYNNMNTKITNFDDVLTSPSLPQIIEIEGFSTELKTTSENLCTSAQARNDTIDNLSTAINVHGAGANQSEIVNTLTEVKSGMETDKNTMITKAAQLDGHTQNMETIQSTTTPIIADWQNGMNSLEDEKTSYFNNLKQTQNNKSTFEKANDKINSIKTTVGGYTQDLVTYTQSFANIASTVNTAKTMITSLANASSNAGPLGMLSKIGNLATGLNSSLNMSVSAASAVNYNVSKINSLNQKNIGKITDIKSTIFTADNSINKNSTSINNNLPVLKTNIATAKTANATLGSSTQSFLTNTAQTTNSMAATQQSITNVQNNSTGVLGKINLGVNSIKTSLGLMSNTQAMFGTLGQVSSLGLDKLTGLKNKALNFGLTDVATKADDCSIFAASEYAAAIDEPYEATTRAKRRGEQIAELLPRKLADDTKVSSTEMYSMIENGRIDNNNAIIPASETITLSDQADTSYIAYDVPTTGLQQEVVTTQEAIGDPEAGELWQQLDTTPTNYNKISEGTSQIASNWKDYSPSSCEEFLSGSDPGMGET